MNTIRPRARRFAFDPRLAIGIALVVASIAGVYAIVTSADETVQVYAASTTLSPGDRIDAGDLTTRNVRLDESIGLYLVPGDVPDEGVVVTRSVGEGELLPASAVGSADGLRLTSVVLAMNGQLAASIEAGSTVDVWSAQQLENDGFAAPGVIISGAIVVRLVSSDTIMAAGETTAVEVLVPKSKIARVLEAVANGDAISIVAASLPVKR